MPKTFSERYDDTVKMSTTEISDLIDHRKSIGKDTGVAEQIYSARTGHRHVYTPPVDDSDSGDDSGSNDYIDMGCGDERWADADENNY